MRIFNGVKHEFSSEAEVTGGTDQLAEVVCELEQTNFMVAGSHHNCQGASGSRAIDETHKCRSRSIYSRTTHHSNLRKLASLELRQFESDEITNPQRFFRIGG